MFPLSVAKARPKVSVLPIMAPRKKAAKNQPQAAPPAQVAKSPAAETPIQPHFGTDLAAYPEVQQNEYLATEAIYPDGFLRVYGKKDAWKVMFLDLGIQACC